SKDFKTQQDDHYRMPGTSAMNENGSAQFKAPVAPFPRAPETNTPPISMPGVHGVQPADPHRREQVKYYANWLAKQAKHDVLNDHSKEIDDYIQEATKVVQVGEKEVAIFAPFRPHLSALQTFTTRQVLALCLLALLWMGGLLLFRLQMLTAVVAAITVMYTFNLILNVSIALRTFQNTPEERVEDEIVHALQEANWPLYTILCPLYREAEVVPQFAKAIQAYD